MAVYHPWLLSPVFWQCGGGGGGGDGGGDGSGGELQRENENQQTFQAESKLTSHNFRGRNLMWFGVWMNLANSWKIQLFALITLSWYHMYFCNIYYIYIEVLGE